MPGQIEDGVGVGDLPVGEHHEAPLEAIGYRLPKYVLQRLHELRAAQVGPDVLRVLARNPQRLCVVLRGSLEERLVLAAKAYDVEATPLR